MSQSCPAAPAPSLHCEHLVTCSTVQGTYTYQCCFCGEESTRVIPYYHTHGPYAAAPARGKKKARPAALTFPD